jgi:hypothetical protein
MDRAVDHMSLVFAKPARRGTARRADLGEQEEAESVYNRLEPLTVFLLSTLK